MDARRLWLMILGAAWALAWAGSFVAFWAVEPTGEGFVRGMNRVMAFLGWQGVAGMLALALWGVARGWPKRSPVRRWSAVPLGLALLLVAGILGVILWARFWP